MNNSVRVYIYAFLSKLFSNILDKKSIEDLKNNLDFLEMLGDRAKNYILNAPIEELESELNIDFSSLFFVNSQPFETAILENREEVLVGLQNPVMQFYYMCGYDINLLKTDIQTPDHIAIEFGFMQNLVQQNLIKKQYEFLNEHILEWAVPYLVGIKDMATTPFYQDVLDFTVEFLIADFDFLTKELKSGIQTV